MVTRDGYPCHDALRNLFFFTDPATTEIYTLSLHDALPISSRCSSALTSSPKASSCRTPTSRSRSTRSEEHTSELQSLRQLVCRLLLEKKKIGRGSGPPAFSMLQNRGRDARRFERGRHRGC